MCFPFLLELTHFLDDISRDFSRVFRNGEFDWVKEIVDISDLDPSLTGSAVIIHIGIG